MPTTTSPAATCTVVVRGDGSRCGAPAVTTFTSPRTGEVLAECADHELVPAGTPDATPVVGSPVRLVHIGVSKVGTVVAIKGGTARVEVPTTKGSRCISRPLAELKLV